jgi:hypothetical protein
MNNPGGGQDAENQGGGPQGGGNGNGNGDGQGGNGNAEDGGGQAPLAYNNAGQFLAAWNTAPIDQARDALEQEARGLVAVPPRTCSLLQCSRPTCDCRRRLVS